MISSGLQRYEFMKRAELKTGEKAMQFTPVAAKQLIEVLLKNMAANNSLRALLGEVSAFAILSKLGNQEVSAQLVNRLVSGEIAVVQSSALAPVGKHNGDKKEATPTKDDIPPATKIRESTDEDRIHSVRFEIVDPDNRPLSGVKLELTLPGSNPKVFDGGKMGIVYLTKLKPGQCDLNMILSSEVYEVVE
jgi:hypothetical protein